LTVSPPLPTCFIAMPFGKKPPPGKETPVIDFDAIFRVMDGAVKAAGLECVRADFEPFGGFIHRHMFERLLLAEFVVADLTFGNPNVAYEVGIRHGATAGSTILVCEERFVGAMGFDFKPFRILPYKLAEDGSFGEDAARSFAESLTQRLQGAMGEDHPTDNPLLQITEWTMREDVAHSKTDVFLDRMRFASGVGRQVADALAAGGGQAALDRLREIEQECVPEKGPVVVQLHTALMALYIGFREVKAFADMVRLFDRMPPELRRKAVVREQLALALNRIAEAREAAKARDEAAVVRQRALAALEEIPETAWTSETFGIRGRIHKGWSDAEHAAGRKHQAEAQLKRAIEVYEEGFRLDPRDYYPGVNAVTLRLRRGKPEDLAAAAQLVPVVRFAVDRAPKPKDEIERYWQCATRFELAAAAKDWERANDLLVDLLGIDSKGWMRETTANNLVILRNAFAGDAEVQTQLDGLLAALGESIGSET
jgi:tetratricopeptide (TPR) repeat protein